jgi:exopolyphosphatase/guanosine-5'-triphosphate,3'-diphosphate pyrophosphatase
MRKAYVAAPFRRRADDIPGRVYGTLGDGTYISVLESLEKVLRAQGFDVCVPHRDEGCWGHVYFDPAVVTRRCFDRIRGSDLVVAIPEASRGVHVELGYAAALGKRLVVFLANEERESTLLPGVLAITPSVLHRFDSYDEIPMTLERILHEFDGSPRDAAAPQPAQGPAVGLIDIGSNTAKLIVARELDGQTHIVSRESRSESRLAENLYPRRLLSDEAIARTAKIVAEFKHEAESLGASTVRAVSTGAAREALNAESFASACRETAGLEVQVLTAQEEAEALHAGVLADFESDLDSFLVFNIGGVSTEITLGSKSHVDSTVNLRLGALSLTERFLSSDPPSVADLRALRACVEASLSAQDSATVEQTPILVHTGGELDYLMITGCPLWPSSLSPSHPAQTDVTTFAAFCERLSSLTLDELRAFMPANPRWMDGALASNELTVAVCRHFDVQTIVPSNRNLVDGLLLQILREGVVAP